MLYSECRHQWHLVPPKYCPNLLQRHKFLFWTIKITNSVIYLQASPSKHSNVKDCQEAASDNFEGKWHSRRTNKPAWIHWSLSRPLNGQAAVVLSSTPALLQTLNSCLELVFLHWEVFGLTPKFPIFCFGCATTSKQLQQMHSPWKPQKHY